MRAVGKVSNHVFILMILRIVGFFSGYPLHEEYIGFILTEKCNSVELWTKDVETKKIW